MARRGKQNRRKQAGGVDIHAPSIAILVMTALVFLSYLFLCGRCEDLGREITRLEGEKEKIQRRLMNEELKWERMKSIANLRPLLARHGLDMDWPDDDHIFRVPQSVWTVYQDRRVVERVQVARAADPVEAGHE